MKKYCLYFDKKIQMCIFHSPLQTSYFKQNKYIFNFIFYFSSKPYFSNIANNMY